jgi:hypothetical protein
MHGSSLGHRWCLLAEPEPLVDNSAVKHPWHGLCAWCDQIIRREPVDDHGVKYHAICHVLREAFVEEYARPDARPEGLIVASPVDARRRATIVTKLNAGTLGRRLPQAAARSAGGRAAEPQWHIGPGDGYRCHACDEPIGEAEYKQGWAGFRVVVHTGCAEAWRYEAARQSDAKTEAPWPLPLKPS